MSMRLALFGLSAVVVTVAGESRAEQAQLPAAAAQPWYERFTAGAALTDQQKGLSLSTSRTDIEIGAEGGAGWGVTVNVRDADRTRALGKDEAALGAFYQFNPRFRIGGELSVSARDTTQLKGPMEPNAAEQGAGVKLESAFKF